MYFRRILFLTFLFFSISLPTLAEIDIVYPKKNGVNIYASSAFFIGNIGNDKKLFVNDNEVNIYKRGAFVYYSPLEYGANQFEFKSTNEDGEVNIRSFILNRPKPVQRKNKCVELSFETFEQYKYLKVVQDNVPLREYPNNSSKRLSHIDKQTFLIVDGQMGDYYRVYTNKSKPFWIEKKFVNEVSTENIVSAFDISNFSYTADRKNEYFYFKTGKKLPFIIKDSNDEIDVSLYYVSSVPEKFKKYAQHIRHNDNLLSFKLKRDKIIGYNFYYDGANMVLKLKKPVSVRKNKPLKNIVVAIDAGHGGTEAGAIGFTRVREADLVLDIAKRLEIILKKEGVKTVMTRDDNASIDLYKRVEIIKSVNPDFSISIHANALPDGINPLERQGTSVFYYDKHSKDFANTLKQVMIEELNTNDDGTKYGNFVLTRIPQTIAVLVEISYMINPYDYENLLDKNFRQKVALSIASGIKKYLTEN